MPLRRFYGKYRGKVTNNIDPLNLGRVQVSVPYIFGDSRLSWAMPCTPYGGDKVGWFAVPPIGANIWVEFENGDLDYPICTGCFWGQGEMPVTPALPTTKVLRTENTTITINDLPGAGGVKLEVNPPAVQVPLTVELNVQGITISCPPATIELKITGIDLTITPAEVKLSPTGVELSSIPAKIQLTSASIDINNAAASIQLSPLSVNVNKGALEVI